MKLAQSQLDFINYCLKEDVGSGDITAALVDSKAAVFADLIVREDAILCGAAWFEAAFNLLDRGTVLFDWCFKEGDLVMAGDRICSLQGPVQTLLTGERTALNFLQTLSSTATATHRAVQHLSGSSCQLLDTRKTIPGLRVAQKYAVRCGGGTNHRIGLFDAFLIKENHIKACGGITNAIAKAKALNPNKPVEVEVENLAELIEAINANADIVMLDNFSNNHIAEAVKLNQGKVKLEVSGNVEPGELSRLAALGVDYISMGALTKHIKAIDFSLRIVGD